MILQADSDAFLTLLHILLPDVRDLCMSSPEALYLRLCHIHGVHYAVTPFHRADAREYEGRVCVPYDYGHLAADNLSDLGGLPWCDGCTRDWKRGIGHCPGLRWF